MSGGQWMVVLIVAMVVIGKIMSRSMGYPGWGNKRERRLARVNDGEEERLREEVRALKERLSVLERIATDPSRSLEDQIEALRDRHGSDIQARDRREREPDRRRLGAFDDTHGRE